jgi:hypothetical protein
MMRLHRALFRSGAAVAGTSAGDAVSDFDFAVPFDLAAATAGAVAALGESNFGASSATRRGEGVVGSGLDWTADDGRESTAGGAAADFEGAFAGVDGAEETPEEVVAWVAAGDLPVEGVACSAAGDLPEEVVACAGAGDFPKEVVA